MGGGYGYFFILGGFLSGKGFLIDKKYALNIKGFVQYGINRFSYILLPACIFIFISTALCYPEKLFDVQLLFRYLTMTFNGQGGGSGIGATWYVFMVMWLYIATIPLCLLYEYYEKKCHIKNANAKAIVLLCILLLAGGIYRCGMALLGFEWYSYRYVSPLANLDLYFAGIISNKINIPLCNKEVKYTMLFTSVLLGAFVAINCAIYYFGELEGYAYLLHIYRNVFPSIYLILVVVLLACSQKIHVREPKAIHFFSKYEYNFYLWHSIILLRISKVIQCQNPLVAHFSTIGITIFIVMAISIIMTSGEHNIGVEIENPYQ